MAPNVTRIGTVGLAVAIGLCAAAAADAPAGRVVLDDPLNGSTKGKQTGGKFVGGGGWTPVGPDDRIVWELPQAVGDGCLEIDVRNFDPARQAVAPKNNFLGLWETLWVSGGKADVPHADNFYWRIGKNYRQVKVKLHTHGFNRFEKAFEPVAGGFDPARTYRLKTAWRNGTVTFSIDGREFLTKDSPAEDPIDRFRFAHVGSDPQFKGATPGPVYANLRVTAYGTK
jgi:hypothetical protein